MTHCANAADEKAKLPDVYFGWRTEAENTKCYGSIGRAGRR